MAEKLFEGQFDDEDVKVVFHQHPIVLRKALIVFLIIILVGALPSLAWPLEVFIYWIFLGSFLLGALIFAYYWMGWYFSIYIVTNQRLIHIDQKGFFKKQVVELGLDKVQNVNYEVPGFQAAIFKFGTIIVQTFVGDLVIDTIHKPEKIHREISHIIRAHRQGSEAEVEEDNE